MNTPERALALITKMALADGHVQSDELGRLEELRKRLGCEKPLAEVAGVAGERSVEELCVGLDAYEDRFVVALYAFLVAQSDRDYSAHERRLFQSLVRELKIDHADAALIRETSRQTNALAPTNPAARVDELCRRSHLASGTPAGSSPTEGA